MSFWREVVVAYNWYVWGLEVCGQGPDHWGEYCGGGYGGTDYQNY